jgi:hypothetical protein
VWAAVFTLAQTVTSTVGTEINYFSILEDGSLQYSSASTSLIILSLTLPIFVSLVIGIIAFFALKTKKDELRQNFFLSSIEGTRLNSIECFRGLSMHSYAFSTHVSKLVNNSPPPANLQNRHTKNMLKFFSLFKIGSKSPQDGGKHQVWYMQVMRSTFSLGDTIKKFSQKLVSWITELAPALEGYVPLIVSDSEDQKSSISLRFKKMDTKFARRLDFPSEVLDKLRCNPKPNLLNLLNVRKFRVRPNDFKIAVKVLCPKFIGNYQLDTYIDSSSGSTSAGCTGECATHSVAGTSACLCLKVDPKYFSDLEVERFKGYLHVGTGIQLTRAGPHMTETPFPIDGNGRFVISELSRSGSCIAHFTIECLNSTAFVDWESFIPDLELTMHIDDPYVIDDDTIDWFKKKELLESRNLKLQIGQVFNDDPNELQKIKKCKKENRPFDAVWVKKEFVLKFSPYEHRALLVCCAIFYDASDAYRCITAATGVEFFMDMRTPHITRLTAHCNTLLITRHM